MLDRVARPFLLIACLAGGVWLLGQGVAELQAGLAHLNWTKVQGEITGLTLSPRAEADQDRSIYRTVRLAYAYTVAASEYTTTVDSRFVTEAQANQFMARNPVGSPVTVLVDPGRPERSVLARAVQPLDLLQIVGGVLLIGGSAWWLGRLLRRRGAEQRPPVQALAPGTPADTPRLATPADSPHLATPADAPDHGTEAQAPETTSPEEVAEPGETAFDNEMQTQEEADLQEGGHEAYNLE